jgi:hypothetical protein
LLPPLPDDVQKLIVELAQSSVIARYDWNDRGVAPPGYIAGMALAYATVVRNLQALDSSAMEMAQQAGDSGDDALAWYRDVFEDFDMPIDDDGIDTLRALFVLMLGLGMRESSGQHCEGRDMSADNVQADTCEAGLFQASWNLSYFNEDESQKLFDQFSQAKPCPQCLLEVFAEGVECSSADWSNYGSGIGAEYQNLAKTCPQFTVEFCGVGLRYAKDHWGPIKRFEAEVRPEANDLFRGVEDILGGVPVA